MERSEADEFIRINLYLLCNKVVDIVNLLRNSRNRLHHSHVYSGFFVDIQQRADSSVESHFHVIEAAYSICCPFGDLIRENMCMSVDYHFAFSFRT